MVTGNAWLACIATLIATRATVARLAAAGGRRLPFSRRLWVVVLALAPCPFVQAAPALIARGGQANMIVAVGANPTAAERTATNELASYMEKMTGATFTSVAEGAVPPGRGAIYVGWTSFTRSHGTDPAKLGPEEWAVRTVGKDLIITGGRPRGTLYGVYEFLEQDLGCHWLDERTEVVPSRPTLLLPDIRRTGKPAFRSREVYDAVRGLNETETGLRAQNLFHARNKVNGVSTYLGEEFGFSDRLGSPNSCHTFYFYIDPKAHFDAHPEWFSMNLNGVRERDWGQLCLTNPEVRRRVLERLREFIAKDQEEAAKEGRPAPVVYDISQNDYHHMCQCPQCKAISDREEADSGLLLDFINEIADGIKGEYPDVLIQTFAYTCTQKPPKTVRPRANVVIRLCDWGGELFRPLSDERNREFRERLGVWSKLARHLSVWDYWITYGDPFPTPYSNLRCLQPDLALMHIKGADWVFAESESAETASFHALKRWLGMKLMQNPAQPVEPLQKVFMQGYYGPAASPMTEYLRYLEARLAADPGRLNDLSVYLRQYLDPAFFERAEQLLTAAEAACGGDAKLLLHVRRERVPVDAALLNLWEHLQRRLPPGATWPFDHEAVLKRYEAERYAVLEFYRSPVTKLAGEAEIAREIEKLRAGTVPLPEALRNLPQGSVMDFTWTDFSEGFMNGKPMATLTPDAQAAGGKAIVYTGNGPEDHKKPLNFGVYDGDRKVFGPSVEIKSADLPQDGKYHWYRIGRFPVTNGVLVWAHWTWYISAHLDRAFDAAVPDPNCDLWVSLKVLGPDYVAGSKDADSIWLDRVLLVRPENGPHP